MDAHPARDTVLDYAGTFDTNNLTIARNGSNIESLAEDMTCNVEDAAFTLVFVGSTVGWKVVPYFGNKTNFASPDPIGSSVPNTGRFTTLTANNGTLTGASAPVLDLAQTWNASGTTFTGARIDITNTASATGSRFLDCIIGGASAIRLARIGSSSYALFSTADTGIGAISTSQASIIANGGVAFVVNSGSGGAYIRSDSPYAWASGTNLVGATTDLFLRRDAANTLAQYNGTAAQTFRIYNTFTSATNFERLNIIAQAAGSVIIGTEKGSGGGTARALEFQTDGATRFTIATNGAITCSSSLSVTSQIVFQGNANIAGNIGGGIIRLNNHLSTGFDRLQFGGGTTSFPALKRDSTVLQARLADDSGYTTMDAQLRAQGAAPATTGATGTAGDIRYDADYIYVCTAANTWKRAAIATW
jgi:hypothetical protein